MHCNFLLFIGAIYHREWDNQKKRKVNCSGRSDTEKKKKKSGRPNMFNSPCSIFQFLAPSLYLCTMHRRPLTSQNTISQLKCLCHLVSCLKLISFFLKWGRAEGMQKRGQGRIEKEWWNVNRSEEHGRRQQSKDWEPTGHDGHDELKPHYHI